MFRKNMQLALIHVAIAMTLVPINSTLNRVMIKELAISATLVAILASLPYLFSPLQVVIGSYSDRHPLFGYRRIPYVAFGLGLCVLGVILAPQAVFFMTENRWLGLLLSVLTFGAWGMGYNIASVSYLSLASELSGEKGRSRTISIMWFMMIVGIIATAASLSRLLETYTPDTLKTAFEIVGLVALGLGLIGIIGLEPRHTGKVQPRDSGHQADWRSLINSVLANPIARAFFFYMIVMLAAILGQDVLLEPYGGEAFGLSVSATTRITSIWGGCMLLTLVLAGYLERRIAKRNVARIGAGLAIAGFAVIAGSGLIAHSGLFYAGVMLLGFGTGLSTVSNLSLMLDMTTTEVGLYIGAWGVANAMARLLGSVMSGVVRDVMTQVFNNAVLGYVIVFALQGGLLVLSLVMLARIDVQKFRNQRQLSTAERAELMQEAS